MHVVGCALPPLMRAFGFAAAGAVAVAGMGPAQLSCPRPTPVLLFLSLFARFVLRAVSR